MLCLKCNGTGNIRTSDGMRVAHLCPTCGGDGFIRDKDEPEISGNDVADEIEAAGPKRYTITERVRGQIQSMRADAMSQGAVHFEPFFSDVEALCNMVEAQRAKAIKDLKAKILAAVTAAIEAVHESAAAPDCAPEAETPHKFRQFRLPPDCHIKGFGKFGE